MGLLDKFKKRFERVGQKDRKPKHVVKEDRGGLTKAELQQAKTIESSGGVKPGEKREKAESGKAGSGSAGKPKRGDTREAYRILLRPIVTERSTTLGSLRKYVFAVAPSANKLEVGKAFAAVYGVRPTDVNILNVGGKTVQFGRVRGATKPWKKAIVTLPAGQKVELFE